MSLSVFFLVPVECVIGQDDAEFNQNDANVEKEGRNSEQTYPFPRQKAAHLKLKFPINEKKGNIRKLILKYD